MLRDKRPDRRIAIVNRYGPPSEAPTGMEAVRLAQSLCAAIPAADIRFFSTRRRYGRDKPAGHVQDETGTVPLAGQSHIAVISPRLTIRRLGGPLRDGGTLTIRQPGLVRLITSITDSVRLCLAAFRWADTVITMSDPPFLSLVAGSMHRVLFPGTVWIEWSLDRYPDLFAAAGLLSPQGRLYRTLKAWDRNLRPAYVIGTGCGMISRLQAARRHPATAALLPAGVRPIPEPLHHSYARINSQCSTGLTLAYAGNIGLLMPAAALGALLIRCRQYPIRCLISGHGARSHELRTMVGSCDHILWRGRLSDQELASADAHIAMLHPNASHLCLPAKAVSALCFGKPLIWIGHTGADAWQIAHGAGWIIPVHPDGRADACAIDEVLEKIMDSELRRRMECRATVAGHILRTLHQNGMGTVVRWLGS